MTEFYGDDIWFLLGVLVVLVLIGPEICEIINYFINDK